MHWAADVSDAQFRTIGVVEVAGAVGVIVPAALGVAPLLSALAAVGLVLTMVGAIATHVRYGEINRLAVPVVTLALAALVAVERFGPHSL
jgi:VIT1/CCC1 family predicted Fe2+/Mn2+ transporter